jgi:hypothetical protein
VKQLALLSFLLTSSWFSIDAIAQNIITIAGGVAGHGSYWGDGGIATAAAIGYFGGLGVDDSGNVYIGDGNNQRLRRVSAVTGIIQTVAGTGVAGYNGDNIQASSAQLNNPGFLSFDNANNLYLADYFRIRKINYLTDTITTFIGNGTSGCTGDGGAATAATIQDEFIVWDNVGNAFVTCGYSIRKVDVSGTVTTIAGSGFPGVTSDGVSATSTNLGAIRGLAVDIHGNIFFSDSTSAIRKISAATGIVTRIAGTADNVWSPYSGDGIQATACHLGTYGIAVDDSGNVYNSDFGNSRIEKIDTFGIIHTIAGTGISGFSGDGGPATAAQISFPENVVLDKCGNVYIADFNNRRVRKVIINPSCTLPRLDSATLSTQQVAIGEPVQVYPNPMHDAVTILNTMGSGELTIVNAIGQVMLHRQITDKKETVRMEDWLAGVYIVMVVDEEGNRSVTRVMKE